MQSSELYALWRARAVEDPDLAAELAAIADDADAINDRFYRDLAFGTGGLRGVFGAGTNRMNLYTIRRATQGLADTLNASGLPKKVALAHDSRHKGELFCREAARVLAANGITAYLYPRLEPTPALSWAVRYLGCGAGICVTASHNPAKYNGYKVYGADGCQITLEMADKVLTAIGKHDYFDSPKLVDYDAAVADGRIVTIDEQCLSDFVDAVLALRPGLHPAERHRSGAGTHTAAPHGGDPPDGGARAGASRRGFSHLSLPQPRDPAGHGNRPEALRHGPPRFDDRHRPGLRPDGRGRAGRTGRLPADQRQRDGRAAL